jgi:uncharacterized protein YqfA (UPF0365 family)
VGGAGEETIIARVGEGTVSSIGSAISHKSVLECQTEYLLNEGQTKVSDARSGVKARFEGRRRPRTP